MEKTYVIDSKLYRLEVLTEQMSTGKLFYFLRGVQDTTDIKRVAYDELPEPYSATTTHLPKGTVICERYSLEILVEDIDTDLQFASYTIPHDTDGNLITAGNCYRTPGGTMFAVKDRQVIPQINKNVDLLHNIDGSEKVDEMAYSMITGENLQSLTVICTLKVLNYGVTSVNLLKAPTPMICSLKSSPMSMRSSVAPSCSVPISKTECVTNTSSVRSAMKSITLTNLKTSTEINSVMAVYKTTTFTARLWANMSMRAKYVMSTMTL